MLVLTRTAGQRVAIGPHVWVTVLECTPGHVRLGIEAPADVEVDREEVRRDKLRHGPRRPRQYRAA